MTHVCRALSNPGEKGSTRVRAVIRIAGVLGGGRGGSLQAAPGLGGREACLAWGWSRAGSLWVPLRTRAQLPLTATPPPPPAQSIIRVLFHDRRLQYTEHQQLEGWRWSRPGDRILDIGESPGPGEADGAPGTRGSFLGAIWTQACPGHLGALLPCVKPHRSWWR